MMVILLALMAACVTGCSGGSASVATTPEVARPALGPGVSTADLDAAMKAARSGGGDPRRVQVLDVAMKELGKKYKWGGNGPDEWDCSGLVKHSYAEVGVRLPRVTYDQVKEGKVLKKEDVRPGDLLFFYNNGHVAIYISNGLMLNAHLGNVIVERLDRYERVLSAVRQVLLPPVSSVTNLTGDSR
jgi:cell wall-associated NlpC family hydrolase